MTRTVELRCDRDPRRLFAKVKAEGGTPTMADGNLIEFACTECRKAEERENGHRPRQVLHRFDVLGTLVETEIIP